MSDTLDVLIGARAEVEKGWCQGEAEDLWGNVCAIGGVARVARGVCGDESLFWAARTALAGPLGGDTFAIVDFNNAPGTTKADVLALFDRAIIAEAVKVTADTAHTFATVS